MPDPVWRLPVPPLAGLEGQGCGALGSGGIAVRIPHSFPVRSSTVQGSHLHAFVPPLVHQGGGTEGSYSGPCGQVRSGTSSPAFSRLLQPAVCCLEDLRVLEPVIDLSTLNLFVDVAHFRMETIQSVLLSVRQGDWMASIDLKETYLQVPVHPDSRRFLRFVAQGNVYQFSALCFGPSTAPQVFTRVMAPVSDILHSWGIRMRQYLDDWLVQSSSRDFPSRSSGSSGSLPRAGDRRQSCEVSPCSISGGTVPRGRDRLPVFPGFSIFGAHRQASVNRRRISILRRSARQYLALASRHAVLSLPSGSRWPSEGEVSTGCGIGEISLSGFPGLRIASGIFGGG